LTAEKKQKQKKAPSGIVRKSEEDKQTLEKRTIKDKHTFIYNE